MRAREFLTESTNIASAEQVWDYIGGIHPADQQGGGFLKSLVMLNPQYELKRVPLTSLHIPNDEDDGNDPYGRAMYVDVDHAKEYSQYQIDKKPLVVDSQGHILDGAHRAWAASELLNKKDIMAWVPVKTRANSPQDLEIRKKFTKPGVAENMDHSQDGRAVEELKAALLAKQDQLQSATDDQVYDIIDKIMTRIARSHSISGQKLHDMWVDRYKQIPDTWVMNENFADGKGPGRPGDSVRHGIPKKATMAELEKASHAKGRKGQLARWQLNMRRGRKKTNEVTVGVLNLGEFAINVDDHAFERAQQRKINLADIDTVLRKIKLPRVIKKIMDIDVGNRFYVLDHVTDVALGFRRIGDKKLVLKTVYSGRPMDLNIAGIITV